MGEASAIAGAVVAALFALAGGLGAWRWYRVETSRAFWVLLRVAQAALAGYVVLVGVLVATGRRPEDRKSTRLNSSHVRLSRMPSSA